MLTSLFLLTEPLVRPQGNLSPRIIRVGLSPSIGPEKTVQPWTVASVPVHRWHGCKEKQAKTEAVFSPDTKAQNMQQIQSKYEITLLHQSENVMLLKGESKVDPRLKGILSENPEHVFPATSGFAAWDYFTLLEHVFGRLSRSHVDR